jgi:ABC-type multidrug transport system ATPase subunit
MIGSGTTMTISNAPQSGQPTVGDENNAGADGARALDTTITAENGGLVLTVTGVSKRFRAGPPWHRHGVDVLDGLSLEVRSGELVGLTGENGSGKSTLMQVVVGMIGRDAGSVQRPARLGYCPQQPLLWDKLTVGEHFELFATAYQMTKEAGLNAANTMLEELQFTKYARFRVEQLSGGTRQKLNLALALMHEPELLLLDEPYSGFDWETYLRFWEMSERRRDNGMGILIVSHLLAERDRLDRVYELRAGKAVLQ